MAHLKLCVLAGFALALGACAQQGSDKTEQCQLPPQPGGDEEGPVGDCCALNDGNRGICLAGMCTNGRVTETNSACGAPGRDARMINNGDLDRRIDPLDGGADEGAGGGGGSDGGDVDGEEADPCEDVACDPGEVCDPATGTCRPRAGGRPAGPCVSAMDCPAGATCLDEAASNGDVPGGFCRVECAEDADCAGGACRQNGGTNICFQRCDQGDACRQDWACLQQEDGVAVCLPDCRAVGCGAGQDCNPDTGECTQAPTPCRYDCQAGEECREGRCVRLNGTCVTDYHCALDDPATAEADGEQCYEGNCVAQEFSECPPNGEAVCDAAQVCVPRQRDMPLAGGVCLFGCLADTDCPLHKICDPDLNGAQACYFRVCGAGAAGDNNGVVRGACEAGGMQQWPGTCIPLSAATPMPGFCFEAGNVPEGGACDSQNEGRDPADRALQCGQGMVCFDDPDDALDPAQDFAGRGACVAMCNPSAPNCNAERTCLNFGQLDNPNTPDDETLVRGFCLRTDCGVIANDCQGGQNCRPYSLVANQGICTAPGQAGHRQPCQRHAECTEQSFCGDPGGGAVCLQTCNPGAAMCPMGENCVQNPGWGFGVCL